MNFDMKNTLKTLFVIFSILTASAILAVDRNVASPSKAVTNISNPPNIIAFNIIENALLALKKLRKQNKVTPKSIETLIKTVLLPHIEINMAVYLTLKKHWSLLSKQQKKAFQQYITQSLINDYAGILITYKQLDDIKISINPKVRRKDNKAIVKLLIAFNDTQTPFKITLKMIHSDRWRVYDLVFSGVSLIKNYRAQFNSHIKRKGLDSLIKKINNKLNNNV